jgi:Right handed beta helix region
MNWTRMILVFAAVAAPPGILPAASAKVLQVGPDKPFKQPGEAVAVAESGDDVQIAGGQYFDCAIVKQDNLTIEGIGPDAVLTDKTCAGKAILVIGGNNVTVRNVTLQRARVPDRNGAGIRAEGGDLTVESTRFINNENGILSADNPSATIRITGSTFTGNGHCEGACAHGVYVGHIKLLHVDHTRFFDTHVGHSIKSRALRTEIFDCDIEDGPTGSSSYLIEAPNGGSLIVERNKMEKGKLTQNYGNTIMIGSEGVTQPTEQITIRDNNFTNDQNRSTTFVNNRTATPAELSGNVFKGPVRPLEGDGSVH